MRQGSAAALPADMDVARGAFGRLHSLGCFWKTIYKTRFDSELIRSLNFDILKFVQLLNKALSQCWDQVVASRALRSRPSQRECAGKSVFCEIISQ